MKRVLSIEIGADYTKVCDIDYRKRNPKIYNSISFETPINTVEDGYIRDKERFAMELKQQLKDAKIKGNDVVYTVASSKIANREIVIPAVKDKKIREIINAGAQDYFPVDISEYTLTYSVLERKKEDSVETLRLLLMAAPDNLIRNYYNFSEILGFHVVAIDYIGNSIYQLAKWEFPQDAVMAVQVNEKATLVNVINNGTLLLQRTIPYGTKDTLNEEIAATILIEETNLLQKEETKEYVMEAMEGILSSIERVTDYYYSKHPDIPIKELALMGDIVKFKNIDQIVSEKLSIPTILLERFNHKVIAKNESNLKEVDFISCIGATIAPVNFLSKDIAAKEARKSGRTSIQLKFAASVLVSVIMIAFSVTQYLKVQVETKILEQEIQSLQPVEKIYAEHTTVLASFNQLKAFDNQAQSPNDTLDALIVKMEQVLPSSCFISSFVINKENLTFTVETNRKLSAAKMIMNFKDIPEITNISIPSIISVTDEIGVKNYNYTLNCEYAVEVQVENGEAGE